MFSVVYSQVKRARTVAFTIFPISMLHNNSVILSTSPVCTNYPHIAGVAGCESELKLRETRLLEAMLSGLDRSVAPARDF